MANKRFKLKLPRINMPSFQFCRLKSASSLPKDPKPAKYRLSPVNPKALDISYPEMLPAPPPPSTPDISFASMRSSDGCDMSSELSRETVETTSSKKKKKKKKITRRTMSHVFNVVDEDDDSLVLLDSSRSFSSERFPIMDDYNNHRRSVRPPNDAVAMRDRKKKIETTSSERETTAKKVRESVAVVKNSEDPYEDFKRSMLEMIVEKQMYDVAELKELLQCFLTLNSRQYHGVIVEAFSDIWEIFFSDPQLNNQLSF